MKCLICNQAYKSNAGLGHHIKSSHNLTTQQYYDSYIATTDKYCPICGKENRFYSFIYGYTIGCCTEHTNLIKYNATNVYASEFVKSKIKQTKLDKYDDENFNNHTKAINTINEVYGVTVNNVANVPQIREKIYQTNMKKLGVAMPFMSDKIQTKICDVKEDKYGERFYTNRDKFYKTMKKNNFISKYELALEEVFKMYNIDCVSQYKDKIRYPYFCDFYLPKFDMFIEINVYPAHGPHPYNSTNIEDQTLINNWLNLANNGKIIYLDWIKRWTEIDVKKRNIAIQNGILYYTLYNLDEINAFIQNVLKISNIDIYDIYQNL